MIRRWIVDTRERLATLRGAVKADRPLYAFGVALLAVDLISILWWSVTRLLYNLEINERLYDVRMLRMDADGGLPEWFNYAKILLLTLLLAYLFLTRKQSIYAALAVLFALVLADDMFEIHESGGKYFAKLFELRPFHGLRPVDFGELITWAILGLSMLPLLLWGLIRSRRGDVANGLALLVPFGALVFFGAFVDQLFHVMRDAFFGADILLGGLEDGGEMIAITVTCVMAAAMVRQSKGDGHRSGSAAGSG